MTKVQIKKLKAIVKKNEKLFKAGKRSFFSNFENEKILFEIVEARKENILKALKKLGIKDEI